MKNLLFLDPSVNFLHPYIMYEQIHLIAFVEMGAQLANKVEPRTVIHIIMQW
jgi:hypothetical protein